jgi:hypothetical protein
MDLALSIRKWKDQVEPKEGSCLWQLVVKIGEIWAYLGEGWPVDRMGRWPT